MKDLMFKGKKVYLTKTVCEICRIKPSSIYNYTAETYKYSFLIKGEDYITLKDSLNKEKFLKENPGFNYGGYYRYSLPAIITLYYESAISKILKRKNRNINKYIQNKESNLSVQADNSEQENNKNNKISVDRSSIDLNLLINLLIQMELDNRQMSNKIVYLENKITELEKDLNNKLDYQEELQSMLTEYLTLKKGA